jgi:hypothetical protein
VKNESDVPPQPPPNVADVVREFLRTSPALEKYRESLTDLARIAWAGESPVDFYLQMSLLLPGLPWLVDRWLGKEVVEALRNTSFYEAHFTQTWPEPAPSARRRSQFAQFEGLLLLSQIEAPGEQAACDQLARLLDQIQAGLLSDRGGTAKRATRRHPLMDVLFELGQPQTIEALAVTLNTAIGKASALYPKVGNFLRQSYLPLVCGQPMTWAPPDDPLDLLDTDKDPQPPAADAATIEFPMFDIPQPNLRAFTANDLADEMSVMVPTDTREKDAMVALSSLWRGEDTWDFFKSIHRLSHSLHWLKPALKERVDFKALQSIGQQIHRTKQSYAENHARKWRQRRYITPKDLNPPRAMHAPSASDRRWGIFQLRGLLMLGRLRWGPDINVAADKALSELICALERTRRWKLSAHEIAAGIPGQHPIEPILDRIGRPETFAILIAELERLLPEIATVHADAGRLLRDAYLPLLKGEQVVWSPMPSGVRKTKRRASTKIRQVRVRVPTREKPLPGESPDEAEPGQTVYRKAEPRKKAVSVKEELLWVQQRIWGSNPLLIRNHFQSICDAEAAILVRALDARILSDIAGGRVDGARTGILVALTLLTGQGPKTWATIAIRPAGTKGAASKPQLRLRTGEFELPIVRPENAFTPSGSIVSLLEPTVASIRLALPPMLHSRISSLLAISMDPWSRDAKQLKVVMDQYIADIAVSVGTGITLARVRNFARARLREVTNDTSMTMLLCGDSFGFSTAPLYYANLSVSAIERAFRTAMWPLFGDDPNTSPQHDGDAARIGSQLLVTSAAARELARSPGAPMHAAGKRKREGVQLVHDHNALTNHVLCMLVAVAGHRPTASLFALKRFDFDTKLFAAIFRDKQCDPAHFFRYAPIADLVSEQIAQYIGHLRNMAGLPGINDSLLRRAKSGVSGEGALFFHLTPDGKPVELDLETWSQSLPANWGALPLNWGRTWLASRGREQGIEADHLAIALGHLEATGYPFSTESPLEPAQLSRVISAPMGQLARTAGWVARKGLCSSDNEDARLEELGPLRDWRRERQSLADESKAFQIEQRLVHRSNLRSKREQGEHLAHSALETVLGRQLPAFDQLTSKPSRQAELDAAESFLKIPAVLSLEALELTQGKIDAAAEGSKVLSIAAQNSLHRYLKNAAKHLGWQCPIPSPWLAAPTLEPTPFFSGMFRATAQVRALREHFSRIPKKPQADVPFTEFEWACGIAIIALCIFAFEPDARRILGILRGRNSAVRSKAIEDLLLIETGDRARVAGIRGLAAIAVVRLDKISSSADLPVSARLDQVLAAQIPPVLSGASPGLLERLCATVAVTNVVELSGLARVALDGKSGCVSMPAVRQRQFLEEGHGLAGSGPSVAATPDPGLRIVRQKCAPSIAHIQYNRLRKALHIGDGPKKFKLTGESLSQANIVAFREPLKRELSAFLAQDDLSPLVSCIAAFAWHMTTHGTREAKPAAWGTVYGYITSFGDELVESAGTFDFLQLESEEYLDLYQDVLDRKDTDCLKATTARVLVDFHSYLQEHHDFEVVDFSDLEDAANRPEYQVDAEMIQPQEFLRGLKGLAAYSSPSPPARGADADLIRLNRQAGIFAILLRASGARHNELTALRFKDVLATPEYAVLFIRPSRYRRLKTSAARRIVDCSRRLTKQQRRIASEWIAAEKARLGNSWKATLPIFGKSNEPKERVASADLRDATLSALEDAVGYRSKIHRARHLVAGEDLLEIWLSDSDWQALRRVRARAHRFVRERAPADVVLPRQLKKQGLRFGHRRSSTTVVNYFHMPWATLSRPYVALQSYADPKSAAVALGISAAGAYKIVERAETTSAYSGRNGLLVKWVSHIAGPPPQIPGGSFGNLRGARTVGNASPIRAFLIERVLRDIQRGLPLVQACLSHGLTSDQMQLLVQGITEIEKKTAFKILPRAEKKSPPRTARLFKDNGAVRQILTLFDEGSEADQELVQSVSRAYVLWASRSRRDVFIWPTREVNQFVALLAKIGIAESLIIRIVLPGEAKFEQLDVLRSRKPRRVLNHALAWMLVTTYVTMTIGE